MSVYSTIVIAVDPSHLDEHIGRRAAALSGSADVVYAVVGAVDPVPADISAAPAPFGFPTGTVDYVALERSRVENVDRALQGYANAIGKPDADIVAKQGQATDTILAVAKELQADLIVIGSHGRSGLRRILGSTASALVHLAPCDVLVVRLSD